MSKCEIRKAELSKITTPSNEIALNGWNCDLKPGQNRSFYRLKQPKIRFEPGSIQEPKVEKDKSKKKIKRELTGVDGSHEVLDLALLAEHERRRPDVRRIRRGSRGGGRGAVGVERDPGGVVAAVLEAAEAVEEDLEDVAALPRHIVVEVGEDPAHPGRGAGGRGF